MLYFKLCMPMFIDTQIPEIAEKLNTKVVDMYDLLNGIKTLIKNSDGYSVVDLCESDTFDEAYFGPEAIIKLCEVNGVDVHPITEVDVPTEFYYESCNILWDDVCYLFARAENRSKRLEKLMEMGAPNIILRNEIRMLVEYLSVLEHNTLYPWDSEDDNEPTHLRSRDGRIYRALKDGGYSMVNGWDKELLEKREHDLKKFSEEFDAMMEEGDE